MQHAMRAFGLNLKRWAEDHPVAAHILAAVLLVGTGCCFTLAIRHGCETKVKAEGFHRRDAENAEKDRSSGKEAMGGCGKGVEPDEPSKNTRSTAKHPWGSSDESGLRGPPPIGKPKRQNPQQPPIVLQAVAPAEGLPNASGANVLGGPRLFFDVLFAHESVGGTVLVGDKGKSRGPYHIQRAYWQDGGGNPKAYDRLVDDRAACERVMLAYFRRYEPEALAQGDYETLARLHNGGPTWRAKPATLTYWRKVKSHL